MCDFLRLIELQKRNPAIQQQVYENLFIKVILFLRFSYSSSFFCTLKLPFSAQIVPFGKPLILQKLCIHLKIEALVIRQLEIFTNYRSYCVSKLEYNLVYRLQISQPEIWLANRKLSVCLTNNLN